jgi:hypothetical protein
MVPEPFIEHNASTAKEFLDYLRLTHPIWENVDRGWRHAWLFRGQGLASWPLIPSIWRTDENSTIRKFLNLHLQESTVERDRDFIRKLLLRVPGYSTELVESILENAFLLYCRTQIEVTLIARLLVQSSLRGIPLPDYIRVQEFVNRYLGGGPEYFIKRLVSKERDAIDRDFQTVIHNNSFFALAQHHGIPTRLLDWTTSPYVAAFFAAENALSSRDGMLAVFAVHEDVLHSRAIINFPFPKSDNPYLYAQRGELTIHTGSSHYLYNGEFPTIDYLLEQRSDWNEEIRPVKITLGADKAPELLRLLSVYEGIARDQLMPTFDNIVHVVKQRFELDFGIGSAKTDIGL